MKRVIFKDLGTIDYKEAWDYQESLFKHIIDMKLKNRGLSENQELHTSNYLLFCEHPHVYTLGKSGSDSNLLINTSDLSKKGVTFYKINRGGDITYHGPGQIVGYPIIDMENFSLDIKNYIFKIEQSIIDTLKTYNITSERLAGATGVWIDTHMTQKVRKICAIGVKASRYVTMHGFAFNVNTDLNYFNLINPCGFTDKGVTSLEKEIGEEVNIEEVKSVLKEKLAKVFGFELL